MRGPGDDDLTALHPHRPNPLSGNPLDRAGAPRDDRDWVAERLGDPASLFVPVWRGRNLVTGMAGGRPEPVLLDRSGAGDLPDGLAWALLGLLGERAVFALDLSPRDLPLPGIDGEFEDLWRVGGLLRPDQAALLGHARGLVHWRARHRFCGVCGAACDPADAGNVMHCRGCGAHHFPRTDPAVIMLVTRNDRALLARSVRFRNARVFSTLAGFVEPGESLEEAVAREVLEETGVRAARVRYHSSQPWPFPASIMLGFHADGLDDAIVLDETELLEARWFSREDLRRPDGFALPPDFSIARRLIEDWLAD